MGRLCLLTLVFLLTGLLADSPGGLAQVTDIQSSDAARRKMSLVAEFSDDDLQGPVSVSVSSDGQFVYTAGYGSPTCFVLAHDKANERLTLVQKITDADHLAGTLSIRLSHDEKYAVTSSCNSASVSLFRRDAATGKLERLSTKRASDPEVSGLGFALEASFSHDDRFVNVLDDTGGVTVFRIVDSVPDPQLEFVEAFRDDDLSGARGLAHHPDLLHLFVACKRSHCLVALQQDAKSGRLKIVDTKRDDTDGVMGLHSAFGVATSKTGDFVYVVSGQHGKGKDNAVGVFRFDPFRKKLELIQEVYPGKVELDGQRARFGGGNEVRANGDSLYACATGSGSIAIFARNPITGKIQLAQMIVDQKIFAWLSGIAIGPQGDYLYCACEKTSVIRVLRKDSPATQ